MRRSCISMINVIFQQLNDLYTYGPWSADGIAVYWQP